MEARAGTEGRGHGVVLLAGTLLIACSACTFVHKVTAEGCTYHSQLGTVSCTINQGKAAQLFSWAFSQLMFPHTLAILAQRKLIQEDHNLEASLPNTGPILLLSPPRKHLVLCYLLYFHSIVTNAYLKRAMAQSLELF